MTWTWEKRRHKPTSQLSKQRGSARGSRFVEQPCARLVFFFCPPLLGEGYKACECHLNPNGARGNVKVESRITSNNVELYSNRTKQMKAVLVLYSKVLSNIPLCGWLAGFPLD